jgi:hypothetical protein
MSAAAVTLEAQRAREPADRRFRTRALPAGADWRALLAPSPPANDRPSGIALRTPAARDLPPEHIAAIDHAVRVAGGGLSPERRWDMRQDLALKLLTNDVPKNVKAWCVTCAQHLVTDAQRDEAYRRRAEDVHTSGAKGGYRKGPIWRKPDPLAWTTTTCVKRSTTLPDVESALIETIDERTERARAQGRAGNPGKAHLGQETRRGDQDSRVSLERSNMTTNVEGVK